jgi:AcrR family transcriptional regulator
MNRVQEAVPDRTGPDRRQRKKQLTKDALIAAALELFAAQGYDHTAVHEITEAVDVSERTFFRYFASKEDLVLSFIGDGAAAFAEALAARPAQEEPLAAARNALQISIRDLSGGQSLANYLSAMRLIDSTPALLAAYLRHLHEQDHKVIEVLAQREGVDPVADRRPRVLAAVIGALVFLSDRDWRAGDDPDPEAMGATFDAYIDAVVPALSGHWGSGAGTSSTTVPTARPSAT